MKTAIIVVIFAAAVYAQINPGEVEYTGPTPPKVNCPEEMCYGKPDGNYEHPTEKHHFMRCSGGIVSCEACWPNDLYFSGRCNQCMYKYEDECYTTEKWAPATTFFCPDMCPQYGPDYKGNINDPNNEYQYIACWYGTTVGCIACPAGLKYNMEQNACLYEGKYLTQPDSSSKIGYPPVGTDPEYA